MEASESRIAADKQPFLDQAVRGALTRYGIATAAITIVLGVKLAFVWPVLGHEKPFILISRRSPSAPGKAAPDPLFGHFF
ncbi:MAG TPA: hypothetical protein VGL13_04100 [Polyangiaceae bacterium]|jgi:hypothetical protein